MDELKQNEDLLVEAIDFDDIDVLEEDIVPCWGCGDGCSCC